jgi:hypothetical protein
MSCAWLAAPIATTTISVAGPGDGGDMACIAGQPDHEPEPEPGELRPDPFSRRAASLLPGLLATTRTDSHPLATTSSCWISYSVRTANSGRTRGRS